MLILKIIIFHLLIQNIGCDCGPAGRRFETDTTKLKISGDYENITNGTPIFGHFVISVEFLAFVSIRTSNIFLQSRYLLINSRIYLLLKQKTLKIFP
jgi:hypothetical protein